MDILKFYSLYLHFCVYFTKINGLPVKLPDFYTKNW